MCGGTAHTYSAHNPEQGLSPRVRGNPPFPYRDAGVLGSIPACAGEPPPPSNATARTSVYPRVCGGTVGTLRILRRDEGLSPRVRGNHLHVARRRTGVGSPRVCGGTSRQNVLPVWSMGLSPRVRGNRLRDLADVGVKGSIPACAGEPSMEIEVVRNHVVYPRVCGGTCCAKVSLCALAGLSPRVRGNPGGPRCHRSCGRSIPACAGEPKPVLCVYESDSAYPRVCGGTPGLASFRSIQPGLSPRVRGNPVSALDGVAASGSIPACAGEPLAK